MRILTGLLIIALSFVSCKKEKEVTNNGLTGKWELSRTYDGYVDGGNFTWRDVAPGSKIYLLFSEDSSFEREEGRGTELPPISNTGNYRVNGNNQLEFITNGPILQKCDITELTPTTLILDVHVIEGVIRYQYKAIARNKSFSFK